MISIVSYISSDIIGIISLIFTMYLLSRSSLLTKLKTKQFMFVCVLTLIIINLEIASIIFMKLKGPLIREVNTVVNMLGFALSPLVALRMAFLFDIRLIKYKARLAIPIYIQASLCVASVFTGWIFSISSMNVYSRGPLFFLNPITSLYALIIFIIAHNQSSKEYDYDEKTYMHCLYAIVLLGNIVQIVFPNVLLIWSCVSICILLYYIFLRDLQLKYDPLTNLRNRMSFEKMMNQIQRVDRVGIAVLDLNDLKKVNDTLGHLEGDKVISKAGEIIRLSFQGIGITYRIGGDEFCVLCKQQDETRVEQSLKMLRILSNEFPGVSIAYGYWCYKKIEGKGIHETFARADRAMYENKRNMKSKSFEM